MKLVESRNFDYHKDYIKRKAQVISLVTKFILREIEEDDLYFDLESIFNPKPGVLTEIKDYITTKKAVNSVINNVTWVDGETGEILKRKKR